MVECCGEERVGDFCSECGAKLSMGTIGGLLRHIQGNVTLATRTDNYYKDQGVEHKRSETIRRKWTSWESELKRLIELDRKTTKASAAD